MKALIYVSCVMLALASQSIAVPPTGRQVVEESWRRFREDVSIEKEDIEVRITYRKRLTEKALTRWIQYSAEGEDKIAIAFTQPKRERIKALIYRHLEGDDEQWLKLPSQRRSRRVSMGDGKAFAGTDLIYEDLRQLVGERIHDFTYSAPRAVKTATGQMREIVATPNKGTVSAYTKRVLRFDKDFACHYIEYHGANGILKAQTNETITKEANGRWRVDTILVKNHVVDRETRLTVADRALLRETPTGVFERSFLTSERF